MTSIKWGEVHSVNVGLIDKQHKHFIGLINQLYDHLETGDISKLPDMIKELTEYADYHFKTEEEYFDKFKYENAELHKAAHRQLQAKMKSFLTRTDDPKTVAFDLLYFLERWFLLHLKGMDRKYSECFNKHGLK